MGALTLKSFSDELREWELIESEGFDPTDGFGANLKLSIRERQIFLAEPSDVSVPWITDRGRLFFDGIFSESLSTSEIKPSWPSFFKEILENIYFLDVLNFKTSQKLSFLFVVGQTSVEVLNMLYLLQQRFSFIKLTTNVKYSSRIDCESSFYINSSKKSIADSELALLVNMNPRYEGYLLNLSLRQRFLKGNFKVFCIGSSLDLTFPTFYVGSNYGLLKDISEGVHPLCRELKKCRNPLVYTNTELFSRADAKLYFSLINRVSSVRNSWQSFNVLSPNLSFSGTFSLNSFSFISSHDFKKASSIYFLEASVDSNSTVNSLIELELLKKFNTFSNVTTLIEHSTVPTDLSKTNAFQGLAYHSLPGSLVFEDNETFVNTEGTLKRSTKLIETKTGLKTNWQVFRKFFSELVKLHRISRFRDNKLLSFNSSNSFNFKNYLTFLYYSNHSLTSLACYLTKVRGNSLSKNYFEFKFKASKLKIKKTKLKYWLDDFFLKNNLDFYSFHSYTLINCSKSVRASSTNFF